MIEGLVVENDFEGVFIVDDWKFKKVVIEFVVYL